MPEPTIRGDLFARFQTVALARPDQPALLNLSGSGNVSFHQLRLKAESTAAGLAARGVCPGDRIAIHMSRSVDAFAAMLGVGLAGAVAVPLDPFYPMARRSFILADCRPKYVLDSWTPDRSGQKSELSPWPVLWLEDLEAEPGRFQSIEQRPPQTPLYLIYTSGSTGTPKGVAGSAAATANRIEWMWNAFPFGSSDVLAARTSPAFVDSVWELYGGLLAGIPTLIVPSRDSSDPTRLIALLRESRATRITVVPALLNLLLEAEPRLGNALPALNLWTSSGEALPRDTAIRFHAAAPNATLLNLYGTTEIAGDATFAIVASPTQPIGARIPIGRPIANTRCYVLGPGQKPVQPGEEGELYVGGQAVALGYYNRPEETAARFLPDPEAPAERMYRTGDRVFEGPDGMLYYAGRGDRQVQIRGNRVELEEIENALIGLNAGIREAVVAAVGLPGELRLIAYIAPTEANSCQLSTLLGQVLPEFACPGKFIGMEALPRLPNGKLARDISRWAPQSHPDPDVSPNDLPATDSEQWIAATWSDLLNVSPVRRTDSFLRLGGDSMQWIRFLLRLGRRQAIGERQESALTMRMSALEAALILDGAGPVSPIPDEGIIIESLTHADVDQTAALAMESFLRAEPMAQALELPSHEFRLFCRQVVDESMRHGTSVVARDRVSGKLVGFCMAHGFDGAMPAASGEAQYPSMSPIFALMEELQAKYVALRGPFEPCEVAEIFMTGCAPGLDALSLAASIEREVCGRLKAHGYRRVITICTHQATVFLSERVHRFESLAVIRYSEFAYRNRKPFESIGSGHPGAVLFEGGL